METLRNKGTGAGGSKTTLNGHSFESKTDNEPRLLTNGFIKGRIPSKKGKHDYIIEKDSVMFMRQNGFKTYMNLKFEKDMIRKPDEAYLIQKGDRMVLKILEKKNQNGEGSVEDKLCNAGYFLKEYKACLGDDFDVEYAYCLSSFLQKKYTSNNKKFEIMRKVHEDEGITVLFGDDEDYFTKLDAWIYS
jgi:hypothetical protein